MIPRTAVLGDVELVDKVVIGGNRTLCDAVDSVHVVCVVLPDTLEFFMLEQAANYLSILSSFSSWDWRIQHY